MRSVEQNSDRDGSCSIFETLVSPLALHAGCGPTTKLCGALWQPGAALPHRHCHSGAQSQQAAQEAFTELQYE
jgi:hypothetical protein